MSKSSYELLLKDNLLESLSPYYVLLYDNEELLISLVGQICDSVWKSIQGWFT